MYAIIKTGGKQCPVKEGDILKIEKIGVEPGTKITLDEVLFYRDEQKSLVGNPLLQNVKVEATVLKHGKDRKIRIFKYKRRKRYERRKGHRQQFTEIKIDKIIAE
ncbi:MAG: 50S ribosomal protein L21 [Candidatus Sumerlaeia bacterium]|nr:50S ribosomal protein L21 [Candidatus Sumerlaeia bacterium]